MVTPLLLALACGTADEPQTSDDATGAADVTLTEMDPVALLTRVSLDVRGVRPTADEIEQVETDPEALDALVSTFLDDPRFGDRILEIFSEIYLTRVDYFSLGADDFGLEDEPGFNRAVGDEPLRLLARVAVEDRPWTDIVTADWTMANDLLVSAFPLEYIDGGGGDADGWRPARYTDSRPAAGVLSTNGLWWRYTTTASNANRGRANQVSRALLCNDYLTRSIEFDRNTNLLDEEAIADAIANNPACVNCHNSLDPLAAYLYGFWIYNEASALEMGSYHPERERLYDDYLGVAPSFFGEPGDNLRDLGQQLAGDARFPNCAVEQVYGALLDRELSLEDMDALTGHREAFLDSGLSMKSLFASVIGDTRYRAADRPDEDVEALGAATTKLASPDLLASQVEALTGFRWTYADYEMLATDLIGLRTLAGGADGRSVTRNAALPNATLMLVQQRLAEAGASYAVVAEAALDPGERTLFTEVDFTETDPDALVAQIQRLHLLIFGQRVQPDGPEVEANQELWATLYAIDPDPADAWAGLLTALLRDPDFLLY